MESGICVRDAERFWSKVQIGNTESCWPWQGRRYRDHYGEFRRLDGRRTAAHRASWEIHHGRPPLPGMMICHHCDNPPCVNPAHLFEGTARDNAEDMTHKGRGVMPDPRPTSLTPDVVATVRAQCQTDLTWEEIAKPLGLSVRHVRSCCSDLPARRKGPKPKVLGTDLLCGRCKQIKLLAAFYASVIHRRSGWCKDCYNAWGRERHERAKESPPCSFLW